MAIGTVTDVIPHLTQWPKNVLQNILQSRQDWEQYERNQSDEAK